MPEIERKFRLRVAPPSEILGDPVHIVQGYLLADPGELRLRRKEDRCYITVKGEGSLSRQEWESEIDPWAFDVLWPHTEGKRIEKMRYRIPYGRSVLEVDAYAGRLAGLVTLECEFSSEEEAGRLALPPWAAKGVDVTNDPTYKNKNLALYGLP